MYQFELKPFRKNWNPALEWEKEVEKIFEGHKTQHAFTPACEIIDEEKSYFISLDIPGLKKEDLDIEVRDNHLYISGERKQVERSDKDSLVRTERRYGKFSRIFTVPQNVNADAIMARFEDGVLELTLPKEEKSQPKKITISNWKKEDLSPELKS